jgi:hypothetical protein
MAHDVASLIYQMTKSAEKKDLANSIKLQLVHGVVGDYEVSKAIIFADNQTIRYNGIVVPNQLTNYKIITQRMFIEFLDILTLQNNCDSFSPDTSYLLCNVIQGNKPVSSCKFVFTETINQEDVLDFAWHDHDHGHGHGHNHGINDNNERSMNNQKCNELDRYLGKFYEFAKCINKK